MEEQQIWTTTTTRKTSCITVEQRNEGTSISTVILITSEFGIDSGSISVSEFAETDGENKRRIRWPGDTVTVQLKLKGLEGFGLKYKSKLSEGREKEVEISCSVTSEGILCDTQASIIEGTKSNKIDTTAYKAEIVVFDHYFEIKLPKQVLKDNPKELHLSWIDFYQLF
eukprot:m.121761 g.121761  ORF g.121761 m.121761 type:complete len:169 (-) comp14404_c1_seq8:1024-1530(-)